MDGRNVATLNESRRRMTLTYVEGAARLGVPLISVAMPMSANSYSDKVVRPFFHGLLPEGEARQMIAYDFGLAANDDFGLLAQLGRDCAGALVVLPVGEAPDDEPEQPLEVLDEIEIGRRLRALPIHPLGVTGTIRASLPGVQPKLLLNLHDGKWCSPDAPHPSTHILKPSIVELEHSVGNEAFCMTLASRAGLVAAATSVAEFDGVRVLISERYDRRPHSNGTTRRLHQEDACQALSILTRVAREKYEAFGGPSLRAIAKVLTQWGGSVTDLLQAVTFSVLMGNADLHGKNLSFLHDDDGTIALAPIYDVMCTTYYDGRQGRRAVDTELGLFIADKTDMLTVTVDDLVAEARAWGMQSATARDAVSSLAARVTVAIDDTVDQLGFEVPAALIERVRERTTSFA
jgi:serine/threonine-protein kinase HipA